jgi:hypothetical protein
VKRAQPVALDSAGAVHARSTIRLPAKPAAPALVDLDAGGLTHRVAGLELAAVVVGLAHHGVQPAVPAQCLAAGRRARRHTSDRSSPPPTDEHPRFLLAALPHPAVHVFYPPRFPLPECLISLPSREQTKEDRRVVKPQHETPEYRAARQRFAIEVKAGRGWCSQPVCVMSTRYIPPGALWDVAHDESGTIILGPSHRLCNRRDGAVRGNRMRARRYFPPGPPRPRRWIL